MTVRILQGHVVDVLAGEPAGSVHTVCTSPPYLWLRSYGTEPQVWATEADERCAGGHDWDEYRRYIEGGGNAGSSREAMSEPGEANAERIKAARWKTGAYCYRCGAWRGELGQEPTPEEYVEHLCSVMDAVGRVLRDDGTLWVNLAGCYYNDPGGQNTVGGARPKNGTGPSTLSSASRKLREVAAISAKAVEANRLHGRQKRGRHPWLKELDWVDVPGLFANAMQRRGWIWRSDVTWAKPSSLPESVQGWRWEDVPEKGLVLRRGNGRPTKSTEAILLFVKQPGAYYDTEAVREPVSAASLRDGRTARGQRGTRGEYGAADGNCGFSPAGRNLRDLWTISPEPLKAEPGESEHYAAYPSALPARCIRAGTSERGCCPRCGAPWARIVSRSVRFEGGSGRAGNTPEGKYQGSEQATSGDYDIRKGPVVENTTHGWRATCSCPAHEPVPCTVLDCFGGAGTTAIAADRLGRDAVLVELKPAYADLARRRITRDAPLLTFGAVSAEAAG